MKTLKRYEAYLLDLDGTMYRGTERIAEAAPFVAWLRQKGIPFLFLTNNSTLPPRKVADKLKSFGIEAHAEEIFTTGLAAAHYLQAQGNGVTVYAIGEEGLHEALRQAGCTMTEEDPEFVVVGLDRKITYEKLATACLAIRKGAKFLSTNGDIVLPTERGLLPGNGSLTKAIETATGVTPLFLGKPERLFVELALQKLQTSADRVLLVGDNLHTDILAGANSGVDTLLVFTGVTTKEELAHSPIRPTYACDTLLDWVAKAETQGETG
ncbi:TIGR01457 family HAD-type hydrolase [Bacillaceae bacterium]